MGSRPGGRTGQAVDVLIIDVDDVLYRYDRALRVERLAAATGATPEAVWLAVFGSGIEDRADAGELTPAEYLGEISYRLGRDLDRSTWTRARAAAVTPMNPTFDLVRSLGDQVDVVGLTNNGLLAKEEEHAIFPELARHGIELYVSAEFGARKPAASVYRGLCSRLGVDPGRAAFADDDQTNAIGARAAGLHGHHFTTIDSLREFLAGLGVRGW